MNRKWSRLVVFGLGFIIHSHLFASGLEDFIIADEETLTAFKSEGVDADAIYLHKDWGKRDSAPIIQVKIFADSKSVGDFSAFYDVLSGKSDNHKYLILDGIMRKFTKDSRVTGFDFLDDISAFFVSLIYYETETQSIWMQYQIWYWSSEKRAKAKCVIASDVEERVSTYYEDSITESMVGLLARCNQLFSVPSKEDAPA